MLLLRELVLVYTFANVCVSARVYAANACTAEVCLIGLSDSLGVRIRKFVCTVCPHIQQVCMFMTHMHVYMFMTHMGACMSARVWMCTYLHAYMDECLHIM